MTGQRSDRAGSRGLNDRKPLPKQGSVTTENASGVGQTAKGGAMICCRNALARHRRGPWGVVSSGRPPTSAVTPIQVTEEQLASAEKAEPKHRAP